MSHTLMMYKDLPDKVKTFADTLLSQSQKEVEKGNTMTVLSFRNYDNHQIDVVMTSHDFGFTFDFQGNFLYAWNYKD